MLKNPGEKYKKNRVKKLKNSGAKIVNIYFNLSNDVTDSYL